MNTTQTINRKYILPDIQSILIDRQISLRLATVSPIHELGTPYTEPGGWETQANKGIEANRGIGTIPPSMQSAPPPATNWNELNW